MSRLLVTTVCRHTEPGEPSGFLYTAETDRSKPTGRCPIIEPPLMHEDPNPRGGMRGAKGITFSENGLFVANHSSVFHFGPDWSPIAEIAHPSCSGIHDILYRNGNLWITSSRNDLVFELALDGSVVRHVNLRALQEVRAATGWAEPNRLDEAAVMDGAIDFRDPRSHKYETYDGAHVNSVCFLPDDSMLIMMGLIFGRGQTQLFTLKKHLKRFGLWQPLVLVNRMVLQPLTGRKKAMNTDMAVNVATGKSAVVRVDTTRKVSVPFVLDGVNTPAHSLLAEPDGTVLFDHTSTGEVVRFDPASREVLWRLKVTDRFLRGLARLDEETLAVGAQTGLCLVDPATEKIKSTIDLSENPNEAVYDIKILPDHFGPLPSELPECK